RPQDIEDLLGSSLGFLAAVGEPEEELRRLAEAWDRGKIGPTAFLPAPGRIGLASLSTDLGVRAESVSFLACGALRPVLDRYFAACRVHLAERHWDLGEMRLGEQTSELQSRGHLGCRLLCDRKNTR